ncbi:MAG: NTP transferase domain-containing protein [Acidobacteriota bacterium]
MQTTKQCLILAAGNGSRLRAISDNLPKPLVEFQGRPILEHVIRHAQQAGIEEFVIVLGYRGDQIRDWCERRLGGAARFTWVVNPDYHKSNGISALKARNALHGNFLLLMADHLFEPETARMMVRQHLAPGEVILGVDPKVDRIFDIDDATKVLRRGDRIVDIGKEIAEYDAIDTGMFLCTPKLFDDLDRASKDGNCSLSDGMRRLARGRRLRALEIDAPWHDLDTPEAFAHADAENLDYAA